MSKVRLARFLIGLGILLIIFTFGYVFYDQRGNTINSAPLPNSLAGFRMRGSVLGSAALEELSWLHSQDFQLNKGAVGAYGQGNEITLYVAGTQLNFKAERLLVAMRDKIARSETPFTPIAERDEGGRIVYELQGMEQRHFYFRSNGLVIWLAVDETISERTITQVLEFYP